MLKPGLYIVATPIGNISDITYRGVSVLKEADYIACENPRNSTYLFNKYDINVQKRIIEYNDHANEYTRNKIISIISSGKSVALISDAGSPLISDPGYKLVQAIQQQGIHVDIVPGPCSVIAALSLSAMPTDKFLFLGFVPKGYDSKIKFLQDYANASATIVMFDTAPRVRETLKALRDVFKDVEVAIVREITKIHQEVIRGDLEEVIAKISSCNLRGEIVLLVNASKHVQNINMDEVQAEAERLLKTLRVKDAAEALYNIYGPKLGNKRDIYKLLVNIKGK